MQKPQSSIIMLIIIVAVILAIASSLALLALQNRPDGPEEEQQAQTEIVNVEGVDVVIQRNPQNGLFMQPVVVQPENVQPEPPAQEDPPATESQPEPQPTQQPEPTAAPQPQPTTAVPLGTVNRNVESIIYRDYTVQNSDTLYNITRQLNTSVTLMATKGIDQDDLVAGTVIQIPVGNPDYCPGMTPYAVGEGDTIFSIAQRRNSTPENLQAINGLDANYTIYSGTIICVP